MKATKFIFIIFLILLTLTLGSTISSAIEISITSSGTCKLINNTYYIVKGDVISIKVYGNKSEKVDISIIYRFKINASNNTYVFEQKSFPIPFKANMLMKAYPVKDLTVEVKKWIFTIKLKPKKIINGVATVSPPAEVPAGNYDIRIYGSTDSDIVYMVSTIKASVTLDMNGELSMNYDTSKLPVGFMLVKANGVSMCIHIVKDAGEIPISTPTTPVTTPTISITTPTTTLTTPITTPTTTTTTPVTTSSTQTIEETPVITTPITTMPTITTATTSITTTTTPKQATTTVTSPIQITNITQIETTTTTPLTPVTTVQEERRISIPGFDLFVAVTSIISATLILICINKRKR